MNCWYLNQDLHRQILSGMFWLHEDVATLDQPGMLLLTYIIFKV